jgi:hypothetical protein
MVKRIDPELVGLSLQDPESVLSVKTILLGDSNE